MRVSKACIMLLLTCATACCVENDELELKQAFSGEMVAYKGNGVDTPQPPTPTPTPSTITTWEELQEAITTNTYYVQRGCVVDASIPFLIARLRLIETNGTAASLSNDDILENQLIFIGETWNKWGVWQITDSSYYLGHNPIRYPLVYGFLLNRSKQQTEKKWWQYWFSGCWR